MEFFKKTSKGTTETSEYQVAGNIGDVLADHAEPVRLDMQQVAGGC